MSLQLYFIHCSYCTALYQTWKGRDESEASESYERAVRLHNIESGSNSFLQICFNVFAVFLLAILPLGTLINGLDVQILWSQTGKAH